MLRKIGVQWVDNIKLMHPGEGYLVKMTGNDTLIYPVSDAIQKRNIKQPIVNAKELHHFPVISGNPVDHIWTIYFKNLKISPLMVYQSKRMMRSPFMMQIKWLVQFI
jgi:hypothetical protein